MASNPDIETNKEPASPMQRSAVLLTELAGIGMRGVWILTLYPLLIWLVIGTLSSYGFQDKVANQERTVPGLVRASDTLSRLGDQKAKLGLELAAVRAEIAEHNQPEGMPAVRARLIERLGRHQEKVTSAEPPRFDNEQYLDQYAELLGDIPEVAEAWRAYQPLRQRLATLEGRASRLQGAVDQAVREEVQLVGSGQLNDLLAEFEFMRMFGYQRFAVMPDQLLTLLLTLSMGALGSLIYITRSYLYAKPVMPFTWYLFRPFLGMVTAISVFVLAKAGQLTITDASLTNNTSENLNPYFISFLAIISGLLAEQAIARIRRAGSGVFGTDAADGPPRWAVGVLGEMEQQGKYAEDLLLHVSEVPEVVKGWLDEQQPVPAEAQRLIAAWLGMPRRRLFTDIPPPGFDSADDTGGDGPG